MILERIVQNLVQIGTVSAVDGRRAKVYFLDRKLTSGWLTVLTNTPTITLSTELDEYPHSHTATVQPWMPTVGTMVVALFLPVQGGGGFILGGL